jgi:hypothetical protein
VLQDPVRLHRLAAEARDEILAPLTTTERERFSRYLERIVHGRGDQPASD